MSLKDTVESTVKAELDGVAALGKQTIESKTYLYPPKGVLYFLQHRELWKPLTSRLAPLATLSIGVISSMFVFTYIPQSIILTFVSGPLAWFSTIALVLSESSAIITTLARTFLIDEALTDLFDGVLIRENCTELVKNGREVEGGSSLNPFGKLGKSLKKPFQRFTPQALVSYFMWLPLNFVPVVGTVMFIFVQGRKQGPAYHARYFQLKDYTQKQAHAFVERNKPKYIAFGTVAMLLQLIPGMSIFFVYTNTVAAALWAIELEKKGLAGPGGEEIEMEAKGEQGEGTKKEL